MEVTAKNVISNPDHARKCISRIVTRTDGAERSEWRFLQICTFSRPVQCRTKRVCIQYIEILRVPLTLQKVMIYIITKFSQFCATTAFNKLILLDKTPWFINTIYYFYIRPEKTTFGGYIYEICLYYIVDGAGHEPWWHHQLISMQDLLWYTYLESNKEYCICAIGKSYFDLHLKKWTF